MKKINNFEKILKIIIMIFIGIGIMYTIFKVFIFNNKNMEIEKINPNKFQVEIYKKEDNLVKQYNVFYTFEDLIEGIYADLEINNYKSIYDKLSQEYKELYSLEEVEKLIKNYTLNNILTTNILNRETTNGRLNFLYKISDTMYLANTDYALIDNEVEILFMLDGNDYVISYFSILKGGI